MGDLRNVLLLEGGQGELRVCSSQVREEPGQERILPRVHWRVSLSPQVTHAEICLSSGACSTAALINLSQNEVCFHFTPIASCILC